MSIRKLFTAVSKGSWGRPDVCETQTYMKRVNIQESLTPPYIQLLPLIPRYHPPGLYPHSEQGGPTGWAGRGRSALETPAPSKHAQTEGGRGEEGGGTCDKGGVGRVGRNQERTPGREAGSASKTKPSWHYPVPVTSAGPTCSMSATAPTLLPQ